jgi:hypothetical protein
MMVQRIKGRRCDWCEVLRKRPHNEHKNNDVAIVRAAIHVPGQLVQVLPLDMCRQCSQTLQSLFKNKKMEGKVLQ